MPASLSPEAWAQIRADYEHTDRPLGEICAEHGISTGTLRDRVRRWGWTPRRLPIPFEGPPPAPAFDVPQFEMPPLDAPPPEALPDSETPAFAGAPPLPSPHRGAEPVGTPADIVPRLQGAVARVLPAIEATVARLAAGPMHPRDVERAGRALASLTRTLRELNGLLERHRAAAGAASATPRDLCEVRQSLARKLESLLAETEAEKQSEAGGVASPAALDQATDEALESHGG